MPDEPSSPDGSRPRLQDEFEPRRSQTNIRRASPVRPAWAIRSSPADHGKSVGRLLPRLQAWQAAHDRSQGMENQPLLTLSLPNSHQSAHRFNQLGRIITNSILKDRLHVFDVFNLLRWIAFDYHQVRLFPGRDRPDAVQLPQILSSVKRCNVNRFNRRESRFNQQLKFALIAKAGRNPPRQKQPSRLHESPLELFFLLERQCPRRRAKLFRLPIPPRQVKPHSRFEKLVLRFD